MNRIIPGLALCVSLLLADGLRAQRQMESLDRGVVAIKQADGRVFLSWRMLGTEPEEIAYNVYCSHGDGKPTRLNEKPITDSTCFVDRTEPAAGETAYFVRAVLDGKEQPPSKAFKLTADAPVRPYLSVPLKTPEGYTPNDASVGDLDGDGRYEIVLHQVGRGRDNSQSGTTTEPILEAYKLDGTMLWRINLGRNIREGAHYTQFMVYDLDGDGRAEVACKTADGTVDGQGKVIGDADADHRNARGYVLEGPEFLTVFDGRTGAALATVDYIPPRGSVRAWGDDYGNRVDRFLACIAYLDGERPSLVMCRGYYTRAVLAAWNWRGGKLTHVWTFDSDDGTPGNRAYRGQGNHGIGAGDVDGDGRDEIVYGSCVIDDNGQGLYSTGLGHGDAMHFADHDPDRPGLEVFKANGDVQNPAGIQMRDAGTGEQIWGVACTGRQGVGRACAIDIDPRHRGSEAWGKGQGVGGLFSAKGEKISEISPRVCNMGVWWDGDLLRELLDGVRVSKWDYENSRELPMFDGGDFDCASNNGSKSNPCLCADILGDWREEIVARTRDGRELRIFTTTIPTEHRLRTLMHDPIYRLSVAWQNVSYNQPAHTGFYLGDGMNSPARPEIKTVTWQETTSRKSATAEQANAVRQENADGSRPTLYVVGDSTASNSRELGWGSHLGKYFDAQKIKVVNRARGGRSSRTFQTEGLWDALLADLKRGDFVLVQFGHNDGGPVNADRARGSLRGLGNESQSITTADGRTEIVHSFGWYMRKYVDDARTRGATPIVLTLTVRNEWRDGKVERGPGQYSNWSREVARSKDAPLVDLNNIVGEIYESMGPERVRSFFPRDHTHTSAEGADLNARSVVAGLRALQGRPLEKYLSAAGKEISPYETKRSPADER